MRPDFHWHESGQVCRMKFVDIHTHKKSNDGSIQLINHPIQQEFPESSELNYSVGFHPWDIDRFEIELMLENLKKLAERKNVLAIGECGLDRFVSKSIELQENVFIKQIDLAEKLAKPLIIHAVKSYPDIIRIKKTRQQNLPWILHGYNGNLQTTRQLLPHGFYFSFGPQILKANKKHIQSIKEIPIDKLFFETDDSPELIETIYIFAAQQLGLSVNEVQAMVFENYKRIFENG